MVVILYSGLVVLYFIFHGCYFVLCLDCLLVGCYVFSCLVVLVVWQFKLFSSLSCSPI